ncbi:MAG: glucose/mannose-6-phosphate isomerase, partial [bacterium]
MAASPSETKMTEQRLDADAIAAVDRSDLLADIVGLPEHLRDAKWKVESAQLTPWDSPGGLVVAGMGGSGIGGLLARAMLGDHA